MKKITSNSRAGRFLKELAKTNGGVLGPSAVVDAARPKASPLHRMFEWDNTKAAEKFRLLQAAEILRVSVTMIQCRNKKCTVRAFVSIGASRGSGNDSYYATAKVLSSAQLRKQMLDDALSELEAFEAKYNTLVELASVFAAIRKLKSA